MKYTGNLPFGTRQTGQYTLGVFSSGTQVITIDANNNVGIGTSSPQTKLHVEGLTRITEGGNTAFYSGNYVRLFNSQAYQFRNSGGSSIAQINLSGASYFNGGNVGIGTTNPSEKLHVSGNIKAEQTTNDNAVLSLSANSTALGTNYQWNLVGANSTQNYGFQIRQASTTYLHINNSAGGNAGNVGIGTTAPSAKLEVNGSLFFRDFVRGYVGSSSTQYVGATWLNANDGIFYVRSADVNKVVLNSNGNSYLNGGNVGIGTTTPSHKLHINGGALSDYYLLNTGATVTPAPGMLFWDADEETVAIQVNGLAYELGQQQAWVAKNQSGSQINKGTVVMTVGTLGNSGRMLIERMVANGTVSSKYILGVTLENIADGGDGKVLHIGKIRQLDTTGTSVGETWNDGDVLWAHPTTAGALTNVEPSAPNLRLPIAFVVHADANGTLAVRITSGNILHELHDVSAATPTNGDLLKYNNGVWENASLASLGIASTSNITLDTVTTTGNTTTNDITVGNIAGANSITLGGIAQLSQNNNQAYIQNLSGSAIITLDSTSSGNGTDNIGFGTVLPSAFVDFSLPSAASRVSFTRGGALKLYIDGNGQLVSYANLVSYGNSLSGGGGMFQYAGGTTTAVVGHRFKHLNNSFTASSGNQTMVEILPSIAQTGTAGYTGLKVNVTETTLGSGDNSLMDLQVGGASKFKVSNTGDVTVAGTLTAQEFRTEYITQTVIFESGSTAFGNTADDTHTFTGSVNIDGDVTATSFTGDGSGLTNIPAGAVSVTLQDVTDNGSYTSNTVSIGGQLRVGDDVAITGSITLSGSITPLNPNSDLGSTNFPWDQSWTDDTYTNRIIGRDTVTEFIISAQNNVSTNASGNIRLVPGPGTGTNFKITYDGASIGHLSSLGPTPFTGLSFTPGKALIDLNGQVQLRSGELWLGGAAYRRAGISVPVGATDVPYLAFSTSTGAAINTLVERMRITDTGNVGIGTTSPNTRLEVAMNDAAGNRVGFTGDGATTGAALWTNWTTGASYLDFRLGGTTSTYTKLRITNDGKVGIGTTGPSAPLHVVGNILNQSGRIYTDAIQGYAANTIQIGDGATVFSLQSRNSKGFIIAGGGGTEDYAHLRTSNATAFSKASGNQYFQYWLPQINQTLGASYTVHQIDVTETSVGTGTSYLAHYRVNSDWKFRVYTDGTVWSKGNGVITGSLGVGIYAPEGKFHVAGGASYFSPEGDSNSGVDSNVFVAQNLNDAAFTSNALTAYNAHTGWDIGSRSTYTISSRVQDGSIYTYAGEHATAPVSNQRYVQFNSTNTNPLLNWTFFQWDGAGSSASDLKKPANLWSVKTFENSTSVEKLSLSGDGDLTAAGDITANAFIGDGSQLTNISAGAVSVTLQDVTNNGNTTTNNIRINTPAASGAGQGLTLNRPAAGTHYHSVEFATDGTVNWSVGQNGNDAFEVYEDGLAVTTRLTIKQGGNVGIGTTNPATKLDVIGTGVFGTMATSRGSYSNGLSLQNNGGQATSLFLWQNGVASAHIGSPANSTSLHIVNSYNTGLITDPNSIVLTNTGNVGIGTTNPAAKLHVIGQTIVDGGVGVVSAGTLHVRQQGNTSSDGIALTSAFVTSHRIWKDANGVLNIGSSSNPSAFVQTIGGNIGIGTTSPSSKLEVKGASGTLYDTQLKIVASEETGAADTGGSLSFVGHDGNAARTHAAVRGLKENSTVGDYSGYLSFDTRANNAGLSEKMRIDGSGNVGIGTTSPATILDVRGSGATSNPASTGTTPSTGTRFRIASSTTATAVLDLGISTGGTTWLQSTDRSDLSTQYSFSLNPNGGNVGIGTTSPGATLHIADAANSGTTSFSANGRITMRGDGVLAWGSSANQGALTWDTGKAIVFGQSGQELNLGANGATNHMVINTAGNVGIGTSTPTFTSGGGLQVSNATQANLRLSDTSNATYNFDLAQSEADTYLINRSATGNLKFRVNSSTEVVTITSGAKVGIGTTSPTSKLHVAGEVVIQGTATVRQAARQADGTPAGTKLETFDGGTYVGAFIDYTIFDTAKNNMRSGTLQMVFDGISTAHFTDNSTLDIGDTTQAIFTVTVATPNTELFFQAPDPDWHVRYHVRYL